MKSDIVRVTNGGEGVDEALQAASASAAYRGLEKKESIRLQLLAEEMLGMLRQITGETEAKFWLTSEGKRFELHLKAQPLMSGRMRRELLSVASSGENAAAVGFMGKLREMFECAFSNTDPRDLTDYSRFYIHGLTLPVGPDSVDPMAFALNASLQDEAVNWSMQQLKANVEQKKDGNPEASAEWDELEKSIVANLADEITVAIRGGEVEMTVYKSF